MVDFLNNFNNSCSHRLFMFDRKISKIEAELRLLEIKLNSIPGFEDGTRKVEPDESDTPAPDDSTQDRENDEETKIPVEESQETQEESEPQPEDDPALAKYFKMVRVGVSIPAVKQKMQAEGFDPELLKM